MPFDGPEFISEAGWSPYKTPTFCQKNSNEVLNGCGHKGLRENSNIYEFGQFRLSTGEKQLLRDGIAVSLTPKAFDLLAVLVENRGHLLEKAELLDRVWPGSFVEEANLSVKMSEVRRALGEGPNDHHYVQTVPRRGYRFVAEVRRIAAASPRVFQPAEDLMPPTALPDSAAEALKVDRSGAQLDIAENGLASKAVEPSENDLPRAKTAASRSGRGPLVLALAALAVIGMAAVGYYFFIPEGSAVPAKKSIAVLPVKPINSSTRDDLFELGIADSLIHRLSSMDGLVVRPLSSTRQYSDIDQDPVAAGREQKSDYVLASNYQLIDGKIRITSQLLNVATGQIDETYKGEKDAANVFAMQDAIATEVGTLLLARFAVASSSPAAKRGTTNEDAYRLYLQGMYLYDRRNFDDARKAVEVFEQAVRLDPNYARAWAGKAHVHRTIGNQRPGNSHEEYERSIEAINKALELDQNLSEAHSALCDNKMYYEYDFDGAERECKRAIELDPNSSLAHQIYARYLNSRGRPDEAMAESKLAIDLEPTSVLNHRVYGTCLYFARRYAETAEQQKRVIAMDEKFSTAYSWLIFALALQDKQSEAFEWWMKYLALRNADEETVKAFQTAFQTSGWQGVMRERVKRFDEREEIYFAGAAYNALIGDKDKSFEYLEKSLEQRELWMANLEVDPRLDNVRGDPRYIDLVRRVRPK